jgi:hypothetical protein
MAWTSRYKARFTKPLVRQLLGIILRDIRPALDDVAGAGVLPEFASYHRSKTAIVQFPGILVAAHDVEFDPEALGTRHQNPVRLVAAVACAHQNPDLLSEMVEDYVRAVDEILTSAWELTPTDFAATDLPLPSPPFEPGTLSPGLGDAVIGLTILGHSMSDVLATDRGMQMAGSLTLAIEVEES